MNVRSLLTGAVGAVICLTQFGTAWSADKVADRRYEQVPEIAPVFGAAATPAVPGRPAGEQLLKGPTPTWIWGADQNKNYHVRRKFTPAGKKAWLKASCDNSATIELNGRRVGVCREWAEPIEIEVSQFLRDGENVLTAAIANDGGPAAFVLKLAIVADDGAVSHLITDENWEVAEKKDATEWAKAKKVAVLGDSPWGNVFLNSGSTGEGRDDFHVPMGFQVERLFTVPKDELGSWVCLTKDDKGRLIVSDQGGLGLCRITPPAIGGKEPTKVEHLDVKISSAQGMVWAFGSLYVVVNGGSNGLYRVRDTNGDDQLDEVVKLKDFRGGGEHGPHAVRLSPDGKSLYVIGGNHTLPPFDLERNANPQTMGGPRKEQLKTKAPGGMASRLPTNWDEDLLLPRQWDANGHAVGILAPGGWVAQTDPEGMGWEIVSSGYRNQYDMAFNADGELFVYDADMEWDFGSPWYRPTRVVHATSGSEFGWRSGTGKWPTYYLDSLPPLVNVGPGSPVGVEFGYGTKFPAKYQKALYICDWTFGTMYAIHMEPDGASYKAVKEEFVSRTPLPLTDNTVGNDGAMYFTVGGRGTQSELYRVTYVGKESTAAVNPHEERGADLRSLRRKLESQHRLAADPKATVEQVWPFLSHADRFIAYAARVALENQPVELWRDRVLKSSNTDALILGAIALARQGEHSDQAALLTALDRLKFADLSLGQQLGWLRALELVLIRLGEPEETTRVGLVSKLEAVYPAANAGLNRELCNLLVSLNSKHVVAKTLPLLMAEPTHAIADPGNQITPKYIPGAPPVPGSTSLQELIERNRGYGGAIASMMANRPDMEQIHLAFALRNLKTGWTVDERKSYFQWFSKAQKWSGGASYQGFLRNIDRDAFENATDIERLAIEALGARKPYQAPELPKPTGPGRDWTRAEILKVAETGLKGRDFKNGQQMYSAIRCVICHRFGGDGGATGPDLTQLAGRFTLQDLTDAIVDPSKVISDQYKALIVATKDGKTHTGRLIGDNGKVIRLVTDAEDPTKSIEIAKDTIEEQHLSGTSLMPKDLLKPLNENEVLDLLAYLLSRGNPGDPLFRK